MFDRSNAARAVKRAARLAVIALVALLFNGCMAQDAPALAETPAPTASPTATSAPTQTPALKPTAAPEPTPFSVVWLSDTQTMAFRRPDALETMGRWIRDNRIKENIVMVVQTGDAVEHGANALQWEAFDLCYNAFKDDVPYFAVSGNHEPGVREKDRTLFLDRPYVIALPEEQKTLSGMAAYTTFSAGGEDFLVLGAGWGAELEALDWMDGVLTAHPDHTAILLFHEFLSPTGRIHKRMLPVYDRLVVPHANVRMLLCGHVPGRHHRIDRFDDDGDGQAERSVSIQLMNYQDITDRCGQLRLLTFDPLLSTIAVTTYSPVTDCYYRDGTHGELPYVLEHAF